MVRQPIDEIRRIYLHTSTLWSELEFPYLSARRSTVYSRLAIVATDTLVMSAYSFPESQDRRIAGSKESRGEEKAQLLSRRAVEPEELLVSGDMWLSPSSAPRTMVTLP